MEASYWHRSSDVVVFGGFKTEGVGGSKLEVVGGTKLVFVGGTKLVVVGGTKLMVPSWRLQDGPLAPCLNDELLKWLHVVSERTDPELLVGALKWIVLLREDGS